MLVALLIVKHILLHYSCNITISFKRILSRAFIIDGPLYPHIYWNSTCSSKSEETDTVGDFLPNAPNLHKLLA